MAGCALAAVCAGQKNKICGYVGPTRFESRGVNEKLARLEKPETRICKQANISDKKRMKHTRTA